MLGSGGTKLEREKQARSPRALEAAGSRLGPGLGAAEPSRQRGMCSDVLFRVVIWEAERGMAQGAQG